jgi:hypothetical protein
MLLTDDAVATVQAAIAPLQGKAGSRPSAQTVVQALVQLEKAAKQARTRYELDDLYGDWRLYFTAGKTAREKSGVIQGRGFYIPAFVQAQISFAPRPHDEPDADADSGSDFEAAQDETHSAADLAAIANQLRLAGVKLRLTGPARYRDRKNLLAFTFDRMQIQIFGKTIYQGRFRQGSANDAPFAQQPIAKLPFFAFFCITEDFIAARGRGGGLAIWVKASSVSNS